MLDLAESLDLLEGWGSVREKQRGAAWKPVEERARICLLWNSAAWQHEAGAAPLWTGCLERGQQAYQRPNVLRAFLEENASGPGRWPEGHSQLKWASFTLILGLSGLAP